MVDTDLPLISSNNNHIIVNTNDKNNNNNILPSSNIPLKQNNEIQDDRNVLPSTYYLDLFMQPLTMRQRRLVTQNDGTLDSIVRGLKTAVSECKFQFRHEKWNCPTFDARHGKPLFGKILKKACKETAFIYAITSAGVAHEISRACSKGTISTCGCDARYPNYQQSLKQEQTNSQTQIHSNANALNDHHNTNDEIMQKSNSIDPNLSTGTSSTNPQKLPLLSPALYSAQYGLVFRNDIGLGNPENWKWGGCSDNVRFGRRFARKFIEAAEKGHDLRYLVNSHNNAAGRSIVTKSMTKFCKCQGLSGSCNLKTCWMRVTPFRSVGTQLHKKYDKAAKVVSNNIPTIDTTMLEREEKMPSFSGEKSNHRHELYRGENVENSILPMNHNLDNNGLALGRDNRELLLLHGSDSNSQQNYNYIIQRITGKRFDTSSVSHYGPKNQYQNVRHNTGNNEYYTFDTNTMYDGSGRKSSKQKKKKMLIERDAASGIEMMFNSLPAASYPTLYSSGQPFNSDQLSHVSYNHNVRPHNDLTNANNKLNPNRNRNEHTVVKSKKHRKNRVLKTKTHMLLRKEPIQMVTTHANTIATVIHHNTTDPYFLDMKPPKKTELVYYEESPNFCDFDPKVSFRGTRNRQCFRPDITANLQSLQLDEVGDSNSSPNSAQKNIGSCDAICCDRGYTSRSVLIVQRCNCTFQWCCHVTCQECAIRKIISTCL